MNDREQAIALARNKIHKYCKVLNLPANVAAKAEYIYRQAYERGITRKRSLRSVLAACIFVACRHEYAYLLFSELVEKIVAPLDSALAFLYYLEHFQYGRGTMVENIMIDLQASSSPFAFSIDGLLVEAEITWVSGGPKMIVLNQFNSGCCSLWYIRDRHLRGPPVLENSSQVVIVDEAQNDKQGVGKEDAKDEEAKSTMVGDNKEDVNDQQTMSLEDVSGMIEAVNNHVQAIKKKGNEVEAEENDWDIIDWKEEQNGDKHAKKISEKSMKPKGWTGALRRGLFG